MAKTGAHRRHLRHSGNRQRSVKSLAARKDHMRHPVDFASTAYERMVKANVARNNKESKR